MLNFGKNLHLLNSPTSKVENEFNDADEPAGRQSFSALSLLSRWNKKINPSSAYTGDGGDGSSAQTSFVEPNPVKELHEVSGLPDGCSTPKSPNTARGNNTNDGGAKPYSWNPLKNRFSFNLSAQGDDSHTSMDSRFEKEINSNNLDSLNGAISSRPPVSTMHRGKILTRSNVGHIGKSPFTQQQPLQQPKRQQHDDLYTTADTGDNDNDIINSNLNAFTRKLSSTTLSSSSLQQRQSQNHLLGDNDPMDSLRFNTNRPSMFHQQQQKQYQQLLRGGGGADDIGVRAKSDFNLIMLISLICGLILSKALRILLLYFRWFQTQIINVRNSFLESHSVWELLDFEDTARYSVRSKVLIMPLVLLCNFVYLVLTVFRYTLSLMLAQVPHSIVTFFQRM